jgi:hypothetical protein
VVTFSPGCPNSNPVPLLEELVIGDGAVHLIFKRSKEALLAHLESILSNVAQLREAEPSGTMENSSTRLFYCFSDTFARSILSASKTSKWRWNIEEKQVMTWGATYQLQEFGTVKQLLKQSATK